MSNSVIVSKFDWTTGNTNIEYLFFVGALDKVNFKILDNSTDGSIGRKYDTAITDHENKWTLFTASYDGSKTNSGIKIYINGTRVDDIDIVSGTYYGMKNTDSLLLVGTRTETTGDLGTFLNGVIDDVRIYDRALSENEIAALFAAF